MKNLHSSQNTSKKAFTLFEVILSLVILGIVLSTISKLFISNDDIKIYYELQELENSYIETKTLENSQNIQFFRY